jgi:erythromycin esterase
MKNKKSLLKSGAFVLLLVTVLGPISARAYFKLHSDGDTLIPPNGKELAWLKERILPINSVEPRSDTKDLNPIHYLLQDVEVVALGEVTHGSSDIYKMKAKLVRYLVEKEDFSIVAIEGSMFDAYKLNDFITLGKDDPEDLLRNMGFWVWDTEELLSLVKWMKTYNDEHTKKILFTGIDMQFYQAAVAGLKSAFSKHNIQYSLEEIQARLLNLYRYRFTFDSTKSTFNLIKNSTLNLDSVEFAKRIFLNKEKYFFSDICSKLDTLIAHSFEKGEEQEWLHQHVEIIRQFSDNSLSTQRDRYMAQNLLWIKNQNPKSKIIVWAHNGHIQKNTYFMGGYLDETLKNSFLSIAFTFSDGFYNATGPKGLNSYEADSANPETYEYYFHKLQQPCFLLDLKHFKKAPECKWLCRPLKFRQIGARYTSNSFVNWDIAKSFDAVLFIDHSTSSNFFYRKK